MSLNPHRGCVSDFGQFGEPVFFVQEDDGQMSVKWYALIASSIQQNVDLGADNVWDTGIFDPSQVEVEPVWISLDAS